MDTGDIILYIFMLAPVGIGMIFLIAWIFSIVLKTKETARRQKIQIHLLYKIALESGVNKAELKNIIQYEIIVE